MPLSLWLRLCLVWGVVTTLLVGSLALLQADRSRLQRQAQRALLLHNEVGRAAEALQQRHLRQLRRAREALLDPQAPHAAARVGWVAERYALDMAAAIDEVQAPLRRLPALGDEPAAPAGDRLLRQLGRLRQQLVPLGSALSSLQEALRQPQAADLRVAQAALQRADDSVMADLAILVDMLHVIAATPGAAPRWVAPWLWGLAPLAWGLGFVWMLRPLRRLRHVALQLDGRRAVGGRPARKLAPLRGPPCSLEEAAVLCHVQELGRACGALTQKLHAGDSESERLRGVVRRAEHDLLLLRSYNENLVNSLRSAVVVTDAGERLSSINHPARALLGLGDGDLGTPFSTTRLAAALQAHHPGQSAHHGKAAVRYEAVSYGAAGVATGSPTLLDVRVAPYRDEGGTPRGLLVLADDVTEAVAIKHQLLRSERLAAVGQLSAQVAHEIRNPLSAIGLNTELLQEEFLAQLPQPKGAEAGELLRGIAAEVERLTEVTEAYLQLARLPRPHLCQVDVNQVVADLFVMLRSEMQAHAIAVELDLCSPAPRVLLDPGQLRQALLNVVRNSREAMAQGGKMWVHTHCTTARGVSIVVEDTGGGISDAVRRRACEPFFSTKPAGTGLGLSLTQQILVEHGGAIELASWQHASEPPGARVTLHFPEALAS